MDDTIGKPCHYIQEDILVGGEDIAEIGAIKDILEGWKDANPDWRTPVARNKSGDGSSLVSKMKSLMHTQDLEIGKIIEGSTERNISFGEGQLTGKHTKRSGM